MKKIQMFLLAIIVIGIGLLLTQKFWLPKVTNSILTFESERQLAKEVKQYRSKKLSEFPKSVLKDEELTVLDLSNNELTSIPAEIGKLQNLVVLSANHNKLTGIPAEIGHIKNLQVLDISYNAITGLPHELGDLQNLQILNVKGNHYSKEDLDYIRNKLPKTVQIIEN